MPIISGPQEFHQDDVFIDLRPAVGIPLYLKYEGFNFAGSIKQKAAVAMVQAAERAGLLHADSVLVESSSGNLGVALSMVAANRGYGFVCVTDSRCNLESRRLMEALGAQVHVVTQPSPDGGLLGARIAHVRALLAADPRHVWLNQYTNPDNWGAHYRTTAPAIHERFPDLDVLFIGAGTTGTLMGCARWFREHRPSVRIVAVDSVGSVIFGHPPGLRMIPGLGAGVRPQLLDESFVDEVVMVPELETVRMCHRLAARGFLLGGSTGTVVSAAERWLAEHADAAGPVAVGVSPDPGERYLDTVYQTNWVQELYGAAALDLPAAVPQSRSPATGPLFGRPAEQRQQEPDRILSARPNPEPSPDRRSTMSPSVPARLAEQRAALERLDRAIISLLSQRLDATAQLRLHSAEAGLGRRTLAEENEVLGRYAHALGRTGTRIALLLLAQDAAPAATADASAPLR